MFSKLGYAIIKKWEIKLCISVYIYCRPQKLGMRLHVFKINLWYDKNWEIKICISVNIYHRLRKLGMKKLCISVNIYHRLPKFGVRTHVFKISLWYDKKMGNKVMYLS